MSAADSRRAFFRQSGWVAVATFVGGALNLVSNFVAQRMPEGQFNIYDTALSALGILTIPALGMQAGFAAQAAGADDEARRVELTSAMRSALLVLSLIWLLLAIACLWGREWVAAQYQLSNPSLLWVVLGIGLVQLLTPVPMGVLQGRQQFFWFGWAILLSFGGRLSVLLVVVWGLHWGALGGLAAVLGGSVLVLFIVAWRTWDGLIGRSGRFDWRAWLRRLLPVTIALGALTVLMQADALIAREKLQPLLSRDEMDGYSAVRKIAQAMVFLIGALTTVMYPKLARSFQRSEPTDVLKLTLGLTAFIGVAGATVASLFPELPLRLLSPGRLLASQGLVAPFCWALVPMALANVLVWSLLARECYRVVPWLAVLAAGYWVALQSFHDRALTIIGVAAVFGLAIFVVCAVFAWLDNGRIRTQTPRLSPESQDP